MFLQHIKQLHGLPNTIISDRGPQFVSGFWQQLCTRCRIWSQLSTAFHRETDGQTERVNAVLVQYPQAYIFHQQDNWSLWLPLAEFATNNHQSETTDITPFFANNSCLPFLNFDISEQWDLLENQDTQEHNTKLHGVHSLIQVEMSST
jgi:hypothetical protein